MSQDTYFSGNGTWFGGYGGAASMAVFAAMLAAPGIVEAEPVESESRYVFPHAGSSTLSGLVEFEQAEDVELYRPRTELGRKLVELRQKAISEGMDLWDADRIAYEVRERRGEI
ncbi:MAG: hypothetical protein JJU06_13050 [Ectothiorhodospiraceae bacterium]|uniref:hypothetical protein n=1 Tax=Thioalkalivibrio sp. HL-Eb18 TaxID=1266913 RepID=UPI0012DD0EFB|nr:hypothetical protein [Thioalkalivibrio sp. HL-Eb18]MCC5811290.1 hypothetical protein [Ectothiorhodospiraceae bacterium]